jgi:hypothetical protein
MLREGRAVDACEILMPPPGAGGVPAFEAGWIGETCSDEAFLRYVDHVNVNRSADLEDLHEQSSREHCLDIWTRRAMLDQFGGLPSLPVLGARAHSAGAPTAC